MVKVKGEVHQERSNNQKNHPSGHLTSSQSCKAESGQRIHSSALWDIPPIHKGDYVEQDENDNRRDPEKGNHQQRSLVVHIRYPPPHSSKGQLEKNQPIHHRKHTHQQPK